MHRRRAATAGAIVALLSLTGCAAATPESPFEMQLHPHGDRGAWFFDEYGDGVDGAYSTDAHLCGISGDIAIEFSAEAGENLVTATDLRTEEEQWHAEGFYCQEGAVLTDTVLIGSVEHSEEPWLGPAIDWQLAETHSGRQLQDIEIAATRLEQLAQYGGVRILVADFTDLYGVTQEGVLWHYTGHEEALFTPLGEPYVGVQNRLGTAFWIVDAEDGQLLRPRGDVDLDSYRFHWASDGYILQPNSQREDARLFNLEGNEVAHVERHFNGRLLPHHGHGVTFSLADYRNAHRVVATGADGHPTFIVQDDGNHLLSEETRFAETVHNVADTAAVSADGSLLLMSNEPGPGSQMVRSDGSVVWSEDQRAEAIVLQGYVVLASPGNTRILIPAKGS